MAGGDALAAVALVAGGDHPRQRLANPRPGDGLHQVVEGVQVELERADGAVLERRHEHDRGRLGEAADDTRELEAVELGHAHVEKQGVVGTLGELAQRLAAAAGELDLGHVGRRLEHPREVLERWPLVVDRQHPQRPPHAARTPGRNFGSVIVTVVPLPGELSI